MVIAFLYTRNRGRYGKVDDPYVNRDAGGRAAAAGAAGAAPPAPAPAPLT